MSSSNPGQESNVLPPPVREGAGEGTSERGTLLYVAPPGEETLAEALSATVIDEQTPAVDPAPDAIPPVREEVVLATRVGGVEEKKPGLGPWSDTANVGERDRRPWWQRAWEDLVCSPIEWVFGGVCMLFGLAILASIPIVQFLSLGYLLEVAGRIARTGKFGEGFIGFRTAARLGGIVLGISACLAPLWFISVNADSALLIDPSGQVAGAWRFGLYVGTALMLVHIAMALYAGGRLRDFFWPVVQFFYGPIDTIRCWLVGEPIAGVWSWLPPIKMFHGIFSGELYQKASDGLWEFVGGMRLPYYFWLGLRGFVGAFLWLVVPITLLATSSQIPGLGILTGFLGYVLFCIVLVYLPFVQTHFAAEGRFNAFFELGEVREQFRRAPLSWWFALLVTLAAALPLYLLKIELTPREVTWLPCLVFVMFIWPTKFLLGWAVGNARHRDEPGFILFRWGSRLAMLPLVMFYALIVYFTQFISWNGVFSLYEQHPFLTPVPFLGN